jgi:hypothetical protein
LASISGGLNSSAPSSQIISMYRKAPPDRPVQLLTHPTRP